MKKEQIANAVQAAVEGRGCFIVDIAVSPDNDIEIAIEKEEGSVDMADCVAINDVVLAAFDRDVEDYALTVTSAGLDQPFKVLRQYQKAVGSKVEVWMRGGRKLVATLVSASEESVTVRYVALEAVEGRKKKEKVEHEDVIALSEINSVRYFVEFKD